MKIARYIGDLLYDYECIVIPGLGGFLTNEKPASIHPVTHHFRPPYKQILFNSFLKTNDGLLLNYIAREEGISYKEAKEQLDHFVLLCHNALKEGKRINFHKVGFLYLNQNEQLSFEQDNSVNYNSDAFGLSTFVSPAIQRTSAEEKLRDLVKKEPAQSVPKKEPRKVRKENQGHPVKPASHPKTLQASRRKSPYRVQLAFLTLLILAMMVGWGFMNKETVSSYYNNYSSVIPLFYSNPNAYLINNVDRVPISKLSNSSTGLWIVNLFEKLNKKSPKENIGATKKSVSPNKPVVKKTDNNLMEVKPVIAETKTGKRREPEYAQPVNKSPVKPMVNKKVETSAASLPELSKNNNPKIVVRSAKQYYIIAGAFKRSQNARKLIIRLKAKGFNNATEAGLTTDGLHRVAFAVFENRMAADKQLLAIRQRENKSAWILEK